MIGNRIGHYQIVSKLGAGGMGEVYRAHDTKLGRDVALKLLPPHLARDPERLARFQREARAVAALNHPHIVTIHSVEDADGVQFLTMELLEGQSLAALIPDGGLPLDRLLPGAVALADALTAAHEKGIVHRDLKPANVMIARDGWLKVLDFGLAKELEPAASDDTAVTVVGQTAVGVVLGTPAYMSPEQVVGRPVDHRTDIFSLGILLYEMASGRRPFAGATAIELASAILSDTPRPLSDLRPDAPAELSRLVRRCLEKDPQRRVQTARDVGNELREVVQSTALDLVSGRRSIVRADAAAATEDEHAPADEGFWVAVLPFKCRGATAEIAALADGLSDEIVTGLAHFSYLRVVARSSTARYADAAIDVRAIAKDIGARYVMEGSVRQAGTQLRVTVQLVDASTGAHLWAETYNRPFQPDTIFDVQDDLVPRIVSTVADASGVLPHSMSATLRGRKPHELTPYEAVLRAFGSFELGTTVEHAEGRECVERAVEKAPGLADAWALLSVFYQDEYRIGYNPRPDSLGRALAAARRAVDAGPSNHLAHWALATAMFTHRDLPAFRQAAERAIALNPMDASVVAYMGTLIAYAGDWQRGSALVERSIPLNPHHAGWQWFFAFHKAYRQHDYAGALDAAIKVNLPGYFYAQAILVAAYGQLGGRDMARSALTHLVAVKPDIATVARELFGNWHYAEPPHVEHILDGLRKAGLDVPP